MPQPVPRIMLSAAGSGAGKTTMTAALLSALCSRGLQVQGGKCGPDYIDPMFHSHITGRPAYHADPFFLSEQPMAELVSRVSADADCAVFEGYLDFTGSVRDNETLNLLCALYDELPEFTFLGNFRETAKEN